MTRFWQWLVQTIALAVVVAAVVTLAVAFWDHEGIYRYFFIILAIIVSYRFLFNPTFMMRRLATRTIAVALVLYKPSVAGFVLGKVFGMSNGQLSWLLEALATIEAFLSDHPYLVMVVVIGTVILAAIEIVNNSDAPNNWLFGMTKQWLSVRQKQATMIAQGIYKDGAAMNSYEIRFDLTYSAHTSSDLAPPTFNTNDTKLFISPIWGIELKRVGAPEDINLGMLDGYKPDDTTTATIIYSVKSHYLRLLLKIRELSNGFLFNRIDSMVVKITDNYAKKYEVLLIMPVNNQE